MVTKTKDGDLYLLQDGTYAAPGDCSAGKDGVLRHTNGLAVALRDDGEPMTLQANAERHGNVMAAKLADQPADDERAAKMEGTTLGEVPAADSASAAAPAAKPAVAEDKKTDKPV